MNFVNGHKPFYISIALILAAGAVTLPGAHFRYDEGWPAFLDFVSRVLGLLIVPAFVSLIARKRYFIWALCSALAYGFVHDAAESFVTKAHLPSSTVELDAYFDAFPVNAIFAAVAASITAGPVSLVRYIIQRRRGVANIPAGGASVESADKEGAWPPPPAVK